MMVIRKRRSPAPGFRTPSPFNPTTGEHAPLGQNVDLTRLALFQVLEEHDDYLVCRGFDPECREFLDEVSVAKPLLLQKTPWHGKTYTIGDEEVTFTYDDPEEEGGISTTRMIEYVDGADTWTVDQAMSYPYFPGDMLTVAKPTTKLGETPGAISESDCELKEAATAIMYDENDKPIAWMDTNSAGRGWTGGVSAIRRIELTANLTIGSNTTAKELEWDTDTSTFAVIGDEFDVYDPFSQFRQSCKPDGEDGARGYAQQYGEDPERWGLIQLQHQARWIEFTTTQAFAKTDDDVTVDGVVYHDGYEPDTAITTVYNKSASSDYIFKGDNNDKGMAVYSPETDKYVITEMESAAVYVSLIQSTASADFSGGSIPINTPSILLGEVYELGSAPTSVNNLMNFAGKSGADVFAVRHQTTGTWYGFIVELSDELYVTEVTVDSGTFKLKKRDRDVRGWFKNDETAADDIHTGTDCS